MESISNAVHFLDTPPFNNSDNKKIFHQQDAGRRSEELRAEQIYWKKVAGCTISENTITQHEYQLLIEGARAR